MYGDLSSPDSHRDVTLVSETASDSAVHYLRSLIFTGELGPGDRLPPERELAERLGISRITLRLALKSLESTGFIVTTRGARGGSRVNSAPLLLRCWNQWMMLHSDEVDDIFELRLTVESRIAALAAERRTEDELRAIEAAFAKEWENPNRTSLFRGDMEIHIAIARAAHSPHLQQVMTEARGELFIPVDQAMTEHREEEAHVSHGAILEAIRNKDAARAAECMGEHIKYVRVLVQRALESSVIAPTPGR